MSSIISLVFIGAAPAMHYCRDMQSPDQSLLSANNGTTYVVESSGPLSPQFHLGPQAEKFGVMAANKLSYVDCALLVIALAGAYFAVTSGRSLRIASAELRRLSSVAGDLVVSDPKQVQLVALKTQHRDEFAWRVYTPAGCTRL